VCFFFLIYYFKFDRLPCAAAAVARLAKLSDREAQLTLTDVRELQKKKKSCNQQLATYTVRVRES
jgi:hypothetical protein